MHYSRRKRPGTDFTEKEIQALKPEAKAYLESEPNGLYVRVSPKGRKTYLTVCTVNGQQKQIRIGTAQEIKLADARKKAREYRELASQGTDPVRLKQQEEAAKRAAPTVEEFSETYLRRHAKPNKRSAAEDERILKKDVLPFLGRLKMEEIKRADITALLDKIADRGAPIMARRTFALLRKIFNYASGRGVLEHSPCHGIQPPGKENKKDRFLNLDEIEAFLKESPTLFTPQTRRALLTVLATGQRPGEVCSMQWEHITDQWWTIPAQKAKNGKEHRVFLSPYTLAQLGPRKEGGFVFPARALQGEPQAPIHPNTLSNALRKQRDRDGLNLDDFNVHDLRRTAASHLARLGTPRFIVARILNHADREVTAIYDRHDYDPEKQVAMEAWGRELEALQTGRKEKADVIPLLARK